MRTVSQWMSGIEALCRWLSWNRQQLEAFQIRRLRALVSHAYRHVPYYRSLFDQAGLKPEDIRTLADLPRIPTTARSALQGLSDRDIIAGGVNPERLIVHKSSGSTGEPFAVRRTWFEDRLLQAFRLVASVSLGFRPTDHRVVVTEVSPTEAVSNAPFYTMLGLLRRTVVDCLLPPEEILARLREAKPDVLAGYSGALSWVTGFATGEDRRLIRPRLIATGAETLTSEMRGQLSECFGARVFDFYGAEEFNLIAWECSGAGRYHVNEAAMIAEILKDGEPAGSGETGELVGTALHSYAMPFIRYRLGDEVTRGEAPCPCGAPVTTIARIQGRVVDRFPLPDGTTVHPYVLSEPLKVAAPWLRRFQLIQEQVDFVRIKVVPLRSSMPSPEAIAAVGRRVAAELGGNVRVETELVEEIPPVKSGKFRPYYSLVSG